MPDEEERPSTGIDAGDGGAPITEALAQAFLVSELQVARPSLAVLPAET
jgi:hypothetical protein